MIGIAICIAALTLLGVWYFVRKKVAVDSWMYVLRGSKRKLSRGLDNPSMDEDFAHDIAQEDKAP